MLYSEHSDGVRSQKITCVVAGNIFKKLLMSRDVLESSLFIRITMQTVQWPLGWF